jgi:hypothetical protein
MAPLRGYSDPVTTLISFPFRLSGSGAVTTRDDADLDYLGEELAQLIRVLPGERELVPAYGMDDPAFSRFDEGMLAEQVDTFGPPVVIDSVTTRFLSDTVQDVVVTFHADIPDEDDITGIGVDPLVGGDTYVVDGVVY